jgi:hypothetical protein
MTINPYIVEHIYKIFIFISKSMIKVIKITHCQPIPSLSFSPFFEEMVGNVTNVVSPSLMWDSSTIHLLKFINLVYAQRVPNIRN